MKYFASALDQSIQGIIMKLDFYCLMLMAHKGWHIAQSIGLFHPCTTEAQQVCQHSFAGDTNPLTRTLALDCQCTPPVYLPCSVRSPVVYTPLQYIYSTVVYTFLPGPIPFTSEMEHSLFYFLTARDFGYLLHHSFSY